jgi:HME family heavy-metal exporter
VTIFGGLISATLIDTILTPLMFLRFGEKPLQRIAEARAADRGSSGAASSAPSGMTEAF